MKELKTFAFLLLSALGLMLGAGILGGKIGYDKGKSKCVTETVTDTVYKTDTIVYHQFSTDTVLKVVKVPFYVTTTDTLVDSVWVELPMEWHLASVPDTADVWYHGVMAEVDSMKFYYCEKVITNTIVKTDYKTPRLTLDVGAGALYHEERINPYLVGEMRYNRPKTTFSAFGGVNYEGEWAAGLNVTYRMNIIK